MNPESVALEIVTLTLPGLVKVSNWTFLSPTAAVPKLILSELALSDAFAKIPANPT